MKARDLFIIILKVFGIYMIKDVLISIPPVLKTFYQFLEFDPDAALFSLIFSLAVLVFYIAIVYFLLYKTSYLVARLNLTKDLSDQTLNINLHRSQVYSIAIITTGIIVLVFSVPSLIRHLYTWFDYMSSRERNFGSQSYDYSALLVSISEVLIGILFLGNQQTLINFMEYKKRKIKVEDPE